MILKPINIHIYGAYETDQKKKREKQIKTNVFFYKQCDTEISFFLLNVYLWSIYFF